MQDAERLLLEAIRYHEAGHSRKAQELYRSLLAIAPHHPDANHNLALILLVSGNIEEALHRFRKALEAYPSHPPFWVSYMDALCQIGRIEEARRVYAQARKHGIRNGEIESLASRLRGAGEVKEPAASPPPSRSNSDLQKGPPLHPEGRTAPSPQVINELHSHYVAGRYAQAEQSAEGLIRRYPQFPFAWMVHGCLRAARGDFKLAAESLYQAARLAPEDAPTHSNLGNVLRSLGRPAEAAAAFREALRLAPNHAETIGNLGNAMNDLGQWEEAEACYRESIRLNPDHADAHCNLGGLLHRLQRLEDAERACRESLRLSPQHAEAFNHLGNILFDRGLTPSAEEAYRTAIVIRPHFAEPFFNLGVALDQRENAGGAKTAYWRAIHSNPSYADAYNNLGNMLHREREPSTERMFRSACCLQPDSTQAFNNLANLMQKSAKIGAAERIYRLCLAIDPYHAEARWNKSLLDLARGLYCEGWANYEWRFLHSKTNLRRKPSLSPPWDGKTRLQGKSLHLYAEQGLGDTLQFFRFALLALEKGAKVTVEVQTELACFLARQHPDIIVIEPTDSTTKADLVYPLMSLPFAFEINLDQIPTPQGYLKASSERRDVWRQRLSSISGPKVGIALSGNPGHVSDSRRSIAWEKIRPLTGQGYSLFCLQKEVREHDVPFLDDHPEIIVLLDHASDFDDTAALCMEMDLVISVDTSVAHLAAALGKETWILLASSADWRWLIERDDSPWYRSARLLRQETPGDWDPTIDRLAQQLHGLLGIPRPH